MRRLLRVIKYLFEMANYLQLPVSLAYEGKQGFLAFHITINLHPFNPPMFLLTTNYILLRRQVIRRIKYQ